MNQIREAQIGDAARIAALLAALDYPGTDDFIEARLRQLLDSADERVLVSEDHGVVNGFISLHFIPQLARRGDFCRISYFCVSPDARGSGIGAQLEQLAVEIARQRGCDRIEVHCHSRRSAAHRFYHRQGYGESPKYLCKSLWD